MDTKNICVMIRLDVCLNMDIIVDSVVYSIEGLCDYLHRKRDVYFDQVL